MYFQALFAIYCYFYLFSFKDEFNNDLEDIRRKHSMEMNKKVSSLENELNDYEKKNTIQTEQIKDLKSFLKII